LSSLGENGFFSILPRGAHAKPYQVKQVRMIILKYRMGRGGEDDSV
jgi:hypothetical protein